MRPRRGSWWVGEGGRGGVGKSPTPPREVGGGGEREGESRGGRVVIECMDVKLWIRVTGSGNPRGGRERANWITKENQKNETSPSIGGKTQRKSEQHSSNSWGKRLSRA